MELDDFLDRLDGVVQAGNGFKALCPSHADKSPSLSVKSGEKGILINCFFGCKPQEVVDSMGLKMSDLFYSSSRQSAYSGGSTKFSAGVQANHALHTIDTLAWILKEGHQPAHVAEQLEECVSVLKRLEKQVQFFNK